MNQGTVALLAVTAIVWVSAIVITVIMFICAWVDIYKLDNSKTQKGMQHAKTYLSYATVAPLLVIGLVAKHLVSGLKLLWRLK